MRIPHAIPYQGSKRKLAPLILNYIPSNTRNLIEPFAGSGAVSIAAAAANLASAYHLNDVNTALIQLWNDILTAPDKLADRYEYLWYRQLSDRRRYYNLVRDRFNHYPTSYYFLYLLARCVKASVRYNAEGHFNQSPDNRRRGKNPKTMRRDLLATHYLLADKTTLSSQDYREILSDVDKHDVVYLDPPYQGTSKSSDPRYIQSIDFNMLVNTLHQMNQLGVSYLLSYDGRTGTKSYGKSLPAHLGLQQLEIEAGRSSQATLLGRNTITYESLYLSPALLLRLDHNPSKPQQLELDMFYG